MTVAETRPDWLREERAEVAVAKILDAASDVFAEMGVHRAGMVDIAEAAGCSRATLYRYFASRDELQSAFVNREAIRLGNEIAAALDDITDPAERLLEGMLTSLRSVRTNPSLSAWFASGEAAGVRHAWMSEVAIATTESFVTSVVGRGRSNKVRERARWVFRVIVSLLESPGTDEAGERQMIESFVVPVVVP